MIEVPTIVIAIVIIMTNSSGTSVSSRDSGSTNELYSSRVPRISLEVLQEK